MNSGILFKKTLIPFLLISFIILFSSGCITGNPVNKGSTGTAKDRGPDNRLLTETLTAMKQTKSYGYKGSGTVQYIGIDDQGVFTLQGACAGPRQSYLQLKMKLGSTGYQTETLYRDSTLYQISQQSWKIVPFSPDTLIQPSYKPVDLLLDQLSAVYSRPVVETTEELDGRKAIVMRLKSDSGKLQKYLQQQFDTTGRLEPERLTGLMNFLKSCTVSQQYTLYIDPQTKRVLKLLFRQNVKINQSDNIKESHLAIDYAISGFGTRVKLPSIN